MIKVRDTVDRLLIASGFVSRETLFDADYYLATYPDVAAAGIDPYRHYLDYGVSENRSPNICFDTQFYLSQTTDRPRDPTRHYLRTGAAAGLDPHPLFETRWYLAANEDVRRAGVNPLKHYLSHGRHEDRETAPRFRRSFGRLAGFSRDTATNSYQSFLFSAPRGPVAGQMHDGYVVMASATEPQRQTLMTALGALAGPCPLDMTLQIGADAPPSFPNVALVFSACYVQSSNRNVVIDAAAIQLHFVDPGQAKFIRTFGAALFVGQR